MMGQLPCNQRKCVTVDRARVVLAKCDHILCKFPDSFAGYFSAVLPCSVVVSYDCDQIERDEIVRRLECLIVVFYRVDVG